MVGSVLGQETNRFAVHSTDFRKVRFDGFERSKISGKSRFRNVTVGSVKKNISVYGGFLPCTNK